MKIHSVVLERKAGSEKDFPVSGLPEVAFLGRSNVGKSSLINSYMGRKNLAKTSATPGKTRALFFYLLNERFYLVDFPGYGYARVSKGLREIWGNLTESYLNAREPLKGMIHIVDIRHSPSAEDKQMAEWLMFNDYPFITVATKADKISRGNYQKHLKIIRTELGLGKEQGLFLFSSKTREGLPEIEKIITGYLRSD